MRNKFDVNKVYIQLTHVEPYFSNEEILSKKTSFQKQVHLKRFYYDTPFTKTGKDQGSVSEQWKRKTICVCEYPFPYMLTRSPVISKSYLEISPLETSTENIQQRIDAFEMCIKHAKLKKDLDSLKTLQQLLQGSVRLQVNRGSIEICEAFLGENRIYYPPEQIEILSQKLKKFLEACQELLVLNKDLSEKNSSNDNKSAEAFHLEMSTGFRELEQEMSPYLKSTNHKESSSSLPCPPGGLPLDVNLLESSFVEKSPSQDISLSSATSI